MTRPCLTTVRDCYAQSNARDGTPRVELFRSRSRSCLPTVTTARVGVAAVVAAFFTAKHAAVTAFMLQLQLFSSDFYQF